MKMTRIYMCEDSMDGIFAAVYDAGKSGYGHAFIKLQLLGSSFCYDRELFSEYIEVKADEEKAKKVLDSVKNKIGRNAYESVMRAAAGNHPQKADVIYHFIVCGFAMGDKVVKALQIDCVRQMFEMNRRILNEAQHYREFIRFFTVQEESSVLMAVFEPENDVLAMVVPFFADRLNTERFIIYDKGRKDVAFYSPDYGWFIQKLTKEEQKQMDGLEKYQGEMADLWKGYTRSISIKERENPDLQRNNLPLRFRVHMTEFQ